MSYEPTTWARGTKITATKLNNIEQGVQSVNSEYTPTTWAEGDIVTATKLNNIEQGIANASGGGGGAEVFNVHFDTEASTETETYLDATWQEVYDAIIANKFVAIVTPEQEDRDLTISITHESSEAGGIAYASAEVTIPTTYPYISYASGSSTQWLATLEADGEQVQLRAASANSKLYFTNA